MIFYFEPIYDEESEILILGSFPSVISRKNNFYYGNPNNRFWKVLARIWNEEVPRTIDEKKEFLLRNHIALADIAIACDIVGSKDESMTNIKARDIRPILEQTNIKKVFCNGRKAEEILKTTGYKKAKYLPSTSPANGAYSLEDLIEIWSKEIRHG
ncbi:MAG: DNA-deoxyinosine glycosylase [Tissierellia bacterium]|nr:DNA-deoxyinosine glycosylase [Tissierellia bacterium]